MKKKILMLALLVLCAAMAIGGTLAYFTDAKNARNVITTGKIDITLIEKNAQGEDWTDTPVEAMPGSEIVKKVTIKNNEAEAWVRAKAVVTVKKGETVMTYEPEMIAIDYNTTDWTEKDGWYYYNDSLKTGGVTKELFTKVTFDGETMGNDYMDTEITIDVSAQAVQTANNGESATTAKGWPQE